MIERICAGNCGEPIPVERLAVQPNAAMCVSCLTNAGDVLPIRRFDEYGADGEQLQTLFVEDGRLERQIRRSNTVVAPIGCYMLATGDDQYLRPIGNQVVDVARGLTSVIVSEDEHKAHKRQYMREYMAKRRNKEKNNGHDGNN